ncbi:hypothetical protein AX17_000191 [Amanita inopinata Kibby_2008]|nr:hypothetical protein AX17_000191 [Amanita inopinata Kibby_2008]
MARDLGDKKIRKQSKHKGDFQGEQSMNASEGSSQEKERKEKKRRRKNKDLDGDSQSIADEPEPLDQGKKTKRKRRETTEAIIESDSIVDGSEKKKKRKKDSETLAPDLVSTQTIYAQPDGRSERKEKKKKHKRDDTREERSERREEDASNAKSNKGKREKREQKEELKASLAQDAVAAPVESASSEEGTSYVTRTNALSPPSAQVSEFLSKHSITIHSVESTIPIISFSQLDIPHQLRDAFIGFKEPTPIQACAWPPALKGQDVVGIAETGSGKTLAFGIPALARLVTLPPTQSKKSKSTASVLVLSPTRELAIQTHDTLSVLGKPFGIASVAVFGGVPKEPQVKMLRNTSKAKDGMTTRIIVGTPGRILDLMQEGACDLSGIDYLVLDEADRMLDKGFENDIRTIISSTKQGTERQTMMFSATWPEAIRRLASTFQRNPVRVTVGSDDLTANSRVEQIVQVLDDSRQKESVFHGQKPAGTSDARVLVFALYKKETARVEQMLRSHGYTVCALHGDMSQNARMEMLEKFKTGHTNLMVATDVAARGLDIPNVGAVINYTFPLTIEDYIHRIGRTGRGGKSGKAITFFTGDNHERSLAGELARVLREGGFDYEVLKRFPMTIKKREHSAYGAFYRNDIPVPKGPTKIVF